MIRDYMPFPASRLSTGATFHQPDQPERPRVREQDPAVSVMTDFRTTRAITVPPSMTMDYACQRMRANRVHLLLVVDDRNTVLGIITSTDIEGERPMRIVQSRGIHRAEILVADVMTPREQLEVLDMEDVSHGKVGHVVATLKAVGRQHAMVVDSDSHGHHTIRGLLSASQIARQLGTVIETTEVARSFAQVEEMLAH